LKAGTELISIDSIHPQEIFGKYRPTFASDGFNNTFHDRFLLRNFYNYQSFEKGLRDSIICQVKWSDSTRLVWFKQPPLEKKKTKGSNVLRTEKRIQGFDNRTQIYSKTLRFADADSTVAILTIRDFTKGKYRTFYKESFQIIDSAHSKALIIDLRNNTGGDIADIRTLFAYLSEKPFRLVTPPMVNSKTSLWPNPFTNIESPIQLAFRILSLPGLVFYDIHHYINTYRGKDGHYYLKYASSKIKQPKTNRFKGNVYVLINGCSFSAASVLSSNLKGSGRATFVGEETGGSTNSCVAGNMPTFKLPGSKLKLVFGLLEISSPYTTLPDGHGIMPDVPIKPTLADRIKGVDPELEWVMETLKTNGFQ
jgi:C-terminal processing protease CtpA/Prc